MTFQRGAGGRIFGVTFNKAEQAAIDQHLDTLFAEYDRANTNAADAVVLWVLHEHFGFGHKRLRRVFDAINRGLDDLCKHYESDDADGAWLCTEKLREYGIDIDAWNKEGTNESKGNDQRT